MVPTRVKCTRSATKNQEVSSTLLNHLRRHLALTFRKLLHLVSGQRDHVGDARHRGGHGQRQAQHSADGQRQCSPNKPEPVLRRKKNYNCLWTPFAKILGNPHAKKTKGILTDLRVQIQVIGSRLLQIVGGSVHDHRGEILIQVTQDCEANRLGCA